MTAQAETLKRNPRDLPAVIPVFPLTGAILLPKGLLPLNIFEPRYLRMIDDALGGARIIGMIQPRDQGGATKPPLYDVGCVGRIVGFQETGDGRYLISLSGLTRFRVAEEIAAATPYRQIKADYAAFTDDTGEDASAAGVDRERLFEAMRGYFSSEGLSTDWKEAASAPAEALVNSLAMGCPFEPNEKQALLEAATLADRADCLVALMRMSVGEPPNDHTLQ
ncbi:MAG: LON peptidase substrate-binding domain-containing protein [Parvularculaceae bacterium]|nr:LON peptidase substrate-binding domain-containing protein [Parvularculaceae bacterium]